MFSDILSELQLPRKCWGPTIYHYWRGSWEPEFPTNHKRLDVKLLLEHIRSGKIIQLSGIGPALCKLFEEWEKTQCQ